VGGTSAVEHGSKLAVSCQYRKWCNYKKMFNFQVQKMLTTLGYWERWVNYESNQQDATSSSYSTTALLVWPWLPSDATIQVNLLFLVSSTCFRRCFRPKHVQLTRNNKLTCIVASCWLLS